ncbi:MAG: hypothetical protein PF495_07270, partial [Spirochaetales bacterium]|nr:hypothetical protein [Spirochaetales bacterium]
MEKIYLIFPGYPVNGGAPAVAVWAIVALRQKFDVYVVGYFNWPLDELNSFFGTDLKMGDFTTVRAFGSGRINQLVSRMPRTLNHCLLSWWVKRNVHDDFCVSMCGEFDFGRPGIQYIHFPFFSDGNVSTYEQASIGCRDTVIRRFYRKVCERLSGWSLDSIKSNHTVCNSNFTAEVTHRAYGIDPDVLYPPVYVENFPEVPWGDRADDVVMLGRMVPYKNQDFGIKVVEQLRARGYLADLHLVGRWGNDDKYNARVK